MVIFGLPGTRRRAFKELAKLAGVLNDLGVKEIVDIGAGAGFPDRLHGISVRHKGELGTWELEKELSRRRLAIFRILRIALQNRRF